MITPSQRAIGRRDNPLVLVDDLEVAQFVYLVLNSEKIRNVLTLTGKKGLLILGRFSPPERKAVLDALRAKLRCLGYIPLMFDFGRVDDRSLTETVRVLAGISRRHRRRNRSKIAPLELQTTVPDYMVPFVPILHEGEKPFSMLADLQNYMWAMPIKLYRDVDQLVEKLETKIIAPKIKLHTDLELLKAKALRLEPLGED